MRIRLAHPNGLSHPDGATHIFDPRKMDTKQMVYWYAGQARIPVCSVVVEVLDLPAAQGRAVERAIAGKGAENLMALVPPSDTDDGTVRLEFRDIIRSDGSRA